MKSILIAFLMAGMAGSAAAGERLSGSHTYTTKAESWFPVPGSGYKMLKMVGTYVPESGPIPESRIECRGANFWSTEVSEASGICVFGDLPDRWMLRYRMTDREPREQRRERFGRRGEWTAIGGVGRFEGITGSGIYLAEPAISANGTNRTMWGGEVTMPDK